MKLVSLEVLGVRIEEVVAKECKMGGDDKLLRVAIVGPPTVVEMVEVASPQTDARDVACYCSRDGSDGAVIAAILSVVNTKSLSSSSVIDAVCQTVQVRFVPRRLIWRSCTLSVRCIDR